MVKARGAALMAAIIVGSICGVGQQVTNTPANVVWTIGKFDHSSSEFRDAFGISYQAAESDVDFMVGRDEDRKWPRFQPGPANGIAGGRLHPFRIHFELKEVPSGSYGLHIAVLYETPRLSSLLLDVNGHTSQIEFHPQLDYAAGDWEGTFVPHTSADEKRIAIPAKFLRKGENVFTFTALDDPSTRQNALGDIAPGISGIIYDALALERKIDPPQEKSRVTFAEATVLFRKTAAGLAEVTNICAIPAPGTPMPSAWSLRIGNETLSQAIPPRQEFGEVCGSFDGPEWKGTQQAEVEFAGEQFQVKLTAQKKWTVHIVPLEHLDIGFTDYRAKVAELQSQSIDGVLDVLPTHPDFRWTMDGSWVAQQYLAGRSPERIAQMLQAIRDGKIVLPPQFANQHTGVASLEGLARSLYDSHFLAQKYDLPVGAAHITDVPSYSWSYASVLHDAGAKYFAAASNNWRAPVLLEGRWNEKSPFYWEGPDGGRVLMWYSRAYLQTASMFGVSPQVEAVKDALPIFLQAYERSDYAADTVLLFGSQLENTPLDRAQVELPHAWEQMYAYPRLDFATFTSAMQDIESHFAGRFATYRGDFGPYWEDGFASGAVATAQHRRNQTRILTAEILSTLPSLMDSDLRPDRTNLNDAWHDMLLFDEHTWTYVGATTQPESAENSRQILEKETYPVRTAAAIDATIDRAWAQLQPQISVKETSIAVFNSLNWPRSGWVSADLPAGQSVLDPNTREPLPQWSRNEAGRKLPGFGGETMHVTFYAGDVPPVGYELFPLGTRVGPSQSASPIEIKGNVLENRFYRVTLNPAAGGIASIWDKELKKELVDRSSAYSFASYIYVTGGDDLPENSLYRYGAAQVLPALTPHAANQGKLISLTKEAGVAIAVMESSTIRTPLVRTEISLPDDKKEIDLRFEIRKDATLEKEAAYIAFPTAVKQPAFGYDTQNGWVDPARDELLGGSREWYAVQHWAAARDPSMTVSMTPLDAPLVAFGSIVRGEWPREFHPASGTILSWIMSNYWNTNFASSQGGDFSFRYRISSSAAFDPATLTREGTKAITPLESSPMEVNEAGRLRGVSGSLLRVDSSSASANIAVSTWKLAEDGRGSILRLEEIAGKGTQATVHLPTMHIIEASRCSLLESDCEALTVHEDTIMVDLKPWQVATLRLQTRPVAQKEQASQ